MWWAVVVSATCVRAWTAPVFSLDEAKTLTAHPPPPQEVAAVALEDDDEQHQRRRRTLRSRFVELCARGWIRDVVGRQRLSIGRLEKVEAVEASECDVETWGRRCPDVVRLAAKDVAWYEKKKRQLRLRELDWEFVNLHSRVLSRGKVGSMVARVAVAGEDLDGSHLWRNLLFSRLAPELGEESASDAKTVIDGSTRRVSVTFFDERGQRKSSVSFSIDAVDGKLNFNAPDLDLKGSKFQFTSIIEKVAETFLSNVFLDVSSALHIQELHFAGDVLHATIVSGRKRTKEHEVHTLLKDDTSFSSSYDTTAAALRYAWLGQGFAPANHHRGDLRPRSFFAEEEDVRFGRRTATSADVWTSLLPQVMFPKWTYRVKALPWFLDSSNAAPRLVVVVFGLVAVLLHVTAGTDEVIFAAAWFLTKAGQLLRYVAAAFVPVFDAWRTVFAALFQHLPQLIHRATCLFLPLFGDGRPSSLRNERTQNDRRNDRRSVFSWFARLFRRRDVDSAA